MPKIFFDPARSTRTCSGSRVFLWGARAASLIAAVRLGLSAASRNGLSTAACSGRIHNTSPVEDSPARTLGALAERTLSNRTRTLRVPRKGTFLRVFLRDCATAQAATKCRLRELQREIRPR